MESQSVTLTTISLVFIVICSLTALADAQTSTGPLSDRVVTTNYGKLRGLRVEFDEENLQQVEAYLGVQYASLHGGALRFMPPTNPMEKWQGVKIANKFRPVCPQKTLDYDSLLEVMPAARVERLRRIGEFTEDQNEDCLFLNIYVPARERAGPAPVVVFVHGEAYDFGTGNAYDGSVLSAHADVVVVTLNYRLGPLGFLSTMDASASGNYALFDLVAALHWIQTNIADFGGDRSRVTLMGHGYGAALSHLLSLAPVTQRLEQDDSSTIYGIKFDDSSTFSYNSATYRLLLGGMNLFSRIILLSGSGLNSWALAGRPRESSLELASALNCMPELKEDEELNTRQLVKCLKNISYVQMMNTEVASDKYAASFGPVVDKIILEGSPEQMIQRKDTLYSEIEVIFGVTKYEGSNLMSENMLDDGLTNQQRVQMLREYVKSQFKYNRQKIVDTFDHHYSDLDKRNDSKEIKHKMIEFLGDGQYNVPAIISGLSHIQRDRETYFYVFSHSAQGSGHSNYQNGHHGEELPFLFGAPRSQNEVSPYGEIEYKKAERILSEAVMRFFGNFIKSGNPNIPLMEGSPTELDIDTLRFLDVYWPRYEQDTQKYLQFGTRPLVNHHYRRNRVALWTELIPKLHQSSEDEEDDDFQVNPAAGSGSSDSNGSRGLHNVRHILPQPPTPPMLPPFRTSSTALAEDETEKPVSDAAEGPDTLIGVKPEPKVETVTKIVYIKRFTNQTRQITKTVPSKQEDGIREPGKDDGMNLYLAITIGVGCALLFLNVVILIGVCCQRDKLKTERKAIEKLTQPTIAPSATAPLMIESSQKNSSLKQSEKAVNMLDNHLYEKAMEKRAMENSSHSNYGDRNPDLNHIERGQGRISPYSSRGQENQYESANHPRHHYQQETSMDSDTPYIRGVPQEPARHPDHDQPPQGFDRCNSYKSNRGEGSRRGSETSMGGRSHREPPVPRQRTLSSGRMSDCEDGTVERRSMRGQRTPRDSVQRSPRTPRVQRTPRQSHEDEYSEPSNSMNRGSRGHRGGPPHMNGAVMHHLQNPQNSDPRGGQRGDPRDYGYHTDSLSPRRHPSSPRRVDESLYQTPRRIKKHGEHDAGSSDSGVQHLTYNGH